VVGGVDDFVDQNWVRVIRASPSVEEFHEVWKKIGAERNHVGKALLGFIFSNGAHFAVAYAVTLGNDFAFFFVNFNASRRAVPSGIMESWL
jgi:hypothetical protein